MPLSRYLAGDYVSEAMRYAWSKGQPYRVMTPDGETAEYPVGMPFGGTDAKEKRRALLPAMQELFDSLPGIRQGHRPWDEASDTEPVFCGLDTEAYESLVREAKLDLEKRPSWILRTATREQAYTPHLAYARYFVPFSFKAPYEQGRETIGSLDRLRAELEQLAPPTGAEKVYRDFRVMCDRAQALRLPLIVDM
jgi:hypothetical protein